MPNANPAGSGQGAARSFDFSPAADRPKASGGSNLGEAEDPNQRSGFAPLSFWTELRAGPRQSQARVDVVKRHPFN